MNTKYLLPCVCGRTLRVSTTQAGESLSCACGARLIVPSLRELPQLEPAPTRTRRTRGKRAWSRRQGWILLGALIATASGVLLLALDLTRPRLPDIESFRPVEVWYIWQDVRRGPDRHLPQAERYYVKLLGIRRVWQTALVAAATAGILVMAAAYAIPGTPSPRSARPTAPG